MRAIVEFIKVWLGAVWLCTMVIAAPAPQKQLTQTAMSKAEIQVDTLSKTIALSAKIYPSKFNAWTSWTKHHHFVVWKNGRASHNALIETDASDLQVLEALLAIGAVAGNNLTADTWEKRADRSNPEPDKRVEGSIVEVSVAWEGQRPLYAEDIFEDKFGKGFLFKFGGHKDLIPIWKSGCIVCLQSCPGGRISNANYTMRDYHDGRSKFEVQSANLPRDGAEVEVILKLQTVP